jgi:hypothetical protein
MLKKFKPKRAAKFTKLKKADPFPKTRRTRNAYRFKAIEGRLEYFRSRNERS